MKNERKLFRVCKARDYQDNFAALCEQSDVNDISLVELVSWRDEKPGGGGGG